MRRLVAGPALLGAALAAPIALTVPAYATTPAHAASAQQLVCPDGYYWYDYRCVPY